MLCQTILLILNHVVVKSHFLQQAITDQVTWLMAVYHQVICAPIIAGISNLLNETISWIEQKHIETGG